MLYEEEERAHPADPARDDAVREMAAAMGYEFKKKKTKRTREVELDNVPPALSTADLDRMLTLACEPSDVDLPLLPFVLLKRVRRILSEDGWKRRAAVERHISETRDAGELCATAAALHCFPFERPLSSPNQMESLRLRLIERSLVMSEYVNAMTPSMFYETQACVFDQIRQNEKPERVFEKFEFARFIGNGANGAAFEAAPSAPTDARALQASRSAFRVSRPEPAALGVHAFLTKRLCKTPAEVFSKHRAYGIARLYYACHECKLDLSKLPQSKDKLGRWSEADWFSLAAMELCDHDLHAWCTMVPRQAVLESFFSAILAQLLCTLDTLSTRFHFVHGDLYLKNVLLKRLPDYDGGEILHFEAQRIHVPAHLCSGYVAKLADFGLSHASDTDPDPHGRRAAFDLHTLACAWLSQIYCAVIARRMSLEDVPHRVVASLRAMVAPPEAFKLDTAEWRHSFAVRRDASTEPDFLKRYEGAAERPALVKRVAKACNSLLRAKFDYSRGLSPAEALKQLPLLEQFKAANPHLSRGKIVPVNS